MVSPTSLIFHTLLKFVPVLPNFLNSEFVTGGLQVCIVNYESCRDNSNVSLINPIVRVVVVIIDDGVQVQRVGFDSGTWNIEDDWFIRFK